MLSGRTRIRSGTAGAGLVLAILALAAPALVAAATVTVNAIPGGGWIQGPDNTGGLAAEIAVSPVAGPGNDSVKLTTATADTDFVGIGRVIAAPLSDITGGSWRTFVTGDSGLLVAEPASMRFGMYRLGGTSEFTTMSVERVYSATVTAGVWQTTTLADDTNVYQTNAAGAFCLVAAPCTFAQFKAQYPDATVLGLQVAIGTGIPVTTSYVDAISLTVGETSDTWNFELAAPAPTPRPTARPTGQPAPATAPPTDVATSTTEAPAADSRAFIILGVVALVALMSVRLRRSRSTD